MTKKIDNAAKFLHDSGLLFKLNLTVLHPLGLALSIVQEDDGAISGFGPLYDSRDDPEGIIFGSATYAEGLLKYAKYCREDNVDGRLGTRRTALGYEMQPLPEDAEEAYAATVAAKKGPEDPEDEE